MTKPVAVGAYLFAGGFTVGMNKHLETVLHFEEGGYGRREFDHNFSIPTFSFNEAGAGVAFADLKDSGVDVVYANPPCAIFSEASRSPGKAELPGRGGANWRTDKRTRCWVQTLELAQELDANIVVIESVRAAVSPARGLDMIEGIEAEWATRGFSSHRVLENASAFGVPQNRKRLLFVLSRLEIDWTAPRATRRTVREALIEAKLLTPGGSHVAIGPAGRTSRLSERELEGIRALGPGEKLNSIMDRVSFLIRRLDPDKSSVVVFGDRTIHPFEDRTLNEHEIKALMGFPLSYTLPEGRYDPKVLGRGVCPPVGAWLGAQLARAIKKGVPVMYPKTQTVAFE